MKSIEEKCPHTCHDVPFRSFDNVPQSQGCDVCLEYHVRHQLTKEKEVKHNFNLATEKCIGCGLHWRVHGFIPPVSEPSEETIEELDAKIAEALAPEPQPTTDKVLEELDLAKWYNDLPTITMHDGNIWNVRPSEVKSIITSALASQREEIREEVKQQFSSDYDVGEDTRLVDVLNIPSLKEGK